MPSLLKPITAVRCPISRRLVTVESCEDCKCVINIRRPWNHYIVKCDPGKAPSKQFKVKSPSELLTQEDVDEEADRILSLQ